MSKRGAKALKDGIEVIQGTPLGPITRAALVLQLSRVLEGRKARTRAALYMVRPGRLSYVVKELIPDMELEAPAALEKAVAIAKRGEVATIYLNAELDKLR